MGDIGAIVVYLLWIALVLGVVAGVVLAALDIAGVI